MKEKINKAVSAVCNGHPSKILYFFCSKGLLLSSQFPKFSLIIPQKSKVTGICGRIVYACSPAPVNPDPRLPDHGQCGEWLQIRTLEPNSLDLSFVSTMFQLGDFNI